MTNEMAEVDKLSQTERMAVLKRAVILVEDTLPDETPDDVIRRLALRCARLEVAMEKKA